MALKLVVLVFGAITIGCFSSAYGASRHLKHITEDNWRQILTGEWMLQFHAPWCPACKDLAKAWDAFADWSKDLNVNVAEIDVTAQPGLSGRFLVTALPTIYHVKDGVFRPYFGNRDKDDLIAVVESKKWTVIEPLSSWKNPDSFQMSVVAWFFKLSMSVRDLHNYLVETKGVPTWGSYAIFGFATLVLGCVLGFLIVCVIDLVFPATLGGKSSNVKADKKQPPNKKDQKKRQTSKNEESEKEKEKEKRKESDKFSEIDSSQQSQTDSQSEVDDYDSDTKARQRKSDNKEKAKPTANGKVTSDSGSKKKK